MKRIWASPPFGAATFSVIMASAIAGIAPAHAAEIDTFISVSAYKFQLVGDEPAETPPPTTATVDSFFFTLDTDRTYDNVAGVVSLFGDFNGPVSFSYDPVSNLLTLGTTTSLQGCFASALPNDGLCLEGVVLPSQGFIRKFYYRTLTSDLYLSSTILNGVPEPSTWALMIAGLGGVGAVMRGRRRVAVARG